MSEDKKRNLEWSKKSDLLRALGWLVTGRLLSKDHNDYCFLYTDENNQMRVYSKTLYELLTYGYIKIKATSWNETFYEITEKGDELITRIIGLIEKGDRDE